MELNQLMKAALRAISQTELNLPKNYRLVRRVTNAVHLHLLKPFYSTWDHRVCSGDHRIPVRLYSPNQDLSERFVQGSWPVLLFFHGGGWVTGNIDSYDRVCTSLAVRTRHLVVSVDYRLAPEHRFPAGLEDCYAVAKEIFLHPGLLNVNPEQITLMGDSAGGNLAAAVSLMARDRGEFLPRRQILVYPAVAADHNPETSPFESLRENGTDYLLTTKRICEYLELYQSSENDLKNPYFAPLIAEDLKNQPDTLVLTAQYDPLRDEGEAYARRLAEEGNNAVLHRVPNALHGFLSLPPAFDPVKEGFRLINRFLYDQKVFP